jgi:hypothetical protein
MDDPPAHVEHLDPKPELAREFCGHFAKPGHETVVLYADGEGGRDAGIVTCHSTVAGDVQTGSWAAVCTCNEWRLLELQITPRN